MQTAVLDEAQAGIKIAGRNINQLRYAEDNTLMAKSEEDPKNLLMKVKEDSEKVGLNSTFRNLRSWQLVPFPHGKQMGKQRKQGETLFSGAPKLLQMVTAAKELKDVCSLQEIYDQPRQNIKKQRHSLSTQVHLVKDMLFPVVVYECKSWIIMKAER